MISQPHKNSQQRWRLLEETAETKMPPRPRGRRPNDEYGNTLPPQATEEVRCSENRWQEKHGEETNEKDKRGQPDGQKDKRSPRHSPNTAEI